MKEYFEITEVEKDPDSNTVHLSERNIIPEAYKLAFTPIFMGTSMGS
jgi:hypothetical protein